MSENHYDTVEHPYICGLDGDICTNVENLDKYMNSEHAGFMEQIYSLTGMHGTPQEILDGLENHQQVMHLIGVGKSKKVILSISMRVPRLCITSRCNH